MTENIIIGTDEAGYGPNLGPLIISASVWNCSEITLPENVISANPRAAVKNALPIIIADSKKLFHGIESLERTVIIAKNVCREENALPKTWRQLFMAFAKNCEADFSNSPWEKDYDAPLSWSRSDDLANDVRIVSNLLDEALEKHNTELLTLRSRVVSPERFNRILDNFLVNFLVNTPSKGTLLSNETLHLVRDIINSHPAKAYYVKCDKHGGRNHYADLLADFFPDAKIETVSEGRLLSQYRFFLGDSSFEFQFIAKGEGYTEIALASMTSKYLREMAMIPFNAFWQKHVLGLTRTAGYPEDAKRFFEHISAAKRRLKIPDNIIWRNR